MARLDALRAAEPAAALSGLLRINPGFEDATVFAEDRGLGADALDALRGDLGLESLRVRETTYLCTPARWRQVRGDVLDALAAFHAEHPELPGVAGERLRLALAAALTKPLFGAVRDRLAAEKQIALQGHWIRLPTHVAELSADDKKVAALVMPLIAHDRFRPPRVRDMGRDLAIAETGVRRTCKALVRTGELIEVAHDHFFRRETVVEMAEIAETLTRTSAIGTFSAADFRDKLDNGRKVAIQILEYFDMHGLTRRQGDLRRVVKAPDLIFGARAEAA